MNQVKMFKLSNTVLDYQRIINVLEQFQIDFFGTGDPVLTDGQLAELNGRQGHIIEFKNTLRKKTAELTQMKRSYYKKTCHQMNAGSVNRHQG